MSLRLILTLNWWIGMGRLCVFAQFLILGDMQIFSQHEVPQPQLFQKMFLMRLKRFPSILSFLNIFINSLDPLKYLVVMNYINEFSNVELTLHPRSKSLCYCIIPFIHCWNQLPKLGFCTYVHNFLVLFDISIMLAS
jgi:hypothetical protein